MPQSLTIVLSKARGHVKCHCGLTREPRPLVIYLLSKVCGGWVACLRLRNLPGVFEQCSSRPLRHMDGSCRRDNTTNRDDTNHMSYRPDPFLARPLKAAVAHHTMTTRSLPRAHALSFPSPWIAGKSHVHRAANASMPTLSFWKRSRRHTHSHDDTGAFSPCWQWIRRFHLAKRQAIPSEIAALRCRPQVKIRRTVCLLG
jgi:hypothetical protein